MFWGFFEPAAYERTLSVHKIKYYSQTVTHDITLINNFASCRYSLCSAAPYPVRPARPWPYLDFEKEKAAAAAAARRHYRGLTWLGRARRAGGAPGIRGAWLYRTNGGFAWPHRNQWTKSQ